MRQPTYANCAKAASMIFDTDVLIWALRNNQRALAALEKSDTREASVVSYMELVQGARDNGELRMIRGFMADLSFHLLPLSENIGHRASIYIETHSLSTRLGIADALIAATAAENELPLCSGNAKHYRGIAGVKLKVFRPA